MINLINYRSFWERLTQSIEGINSSMPLTIDRDMGKKIQSLPADSVTLFFLPPVAQGIGSNVDNYKTECECLIFIMKKYNPQRMQSFSILEETQSAMDYVVERLLAECAYECAPFIVKPESIEISPETELYGSFAGWSIQFKAS